MNKFCLKAEFGRDVKERPKARFLGELFSRGKDGVLWYSLSGPVAV